MLCEEILLLLISLIYIFQKKNLISKTKETAITINLLSAARHATHLQDGSPSCSLEWLTWSKQFKKRFKVMEFKNIFIAFIISRLYESGNNVRRQKSKVT